jgi:hypothetical protein
MRSNRAAFCGLLLTCVAFATQRAQADITFSSLPGASINFNGDGTFNFPNATSGNSFQTDVGDAGNISGTYTIGTVSTVFSVSSASVTGSGTLTIVDQNHVSLTGAVDWKDVTQVGTAGALNINGELNLSSIVYSGTEADLLALKNAGQGSAVVSFQFTPSVSLADLKATKNSTSFSGSIGIVPEPSTLFAGAMLILPFGFSALRILRRKSAV